MHDQFSLSITLGNDGMRTLDDVADALERVAHRLSSGYDTEGTIADVNGNTVGTFAVSAAAPDDRAIQYGPPPLRPGYRWETAQERDARHAALEN